MKTTRMTGMIAIFAATVGLLLPQPLLAASPTPAKAATPESTQNGMMRDVALQKGGVFIGRLVDPGGAPIASAAVSLLHDNKVVANTLTDKQGKFAFGRLRGGIYQVVAPGARQLYRLWAAGTAPKSAVNVAHLVANESIARGQFTRGKVGKFITSPLGLAAIAATAVAVPVALHNSDRDSSE